MKFSIRDLLLVTVIVALAAAWWVDRSRLASEVNRLTKKPSLIDVINRSFEEEAKKYPNPFVPAPKLPKD